MDEGLNDVVHIGFGTLISAGQSVGNESERRMTIRLTGDMLIELGYESLTAAQANVLLEDIYQTLERVVGMTLARTMTNEQLDRFEWFIDNNDEQGALAWLETNFPNYRELVQEAFEEVKAELRRVADEASSRSRYA